MMNREGFKPVEIADAGSGFGQYVYYLSKRYPEAQITGLDIKQEQVDDCNHFFAAIKRDEKVNFKYADLTKLEEEDVWDLALSVDVMEHIEDDRTVFRHLYKGLKAGWLPVDLNSI